MAVLVLVAVISACGGKKPGATASCVDTLSCYRACPSLASECTTKCDALATPAARIASLALLECMGTSGCADENCASTACASQMQACASAGAAPAAVAAPAANVNAVSDKDFEFVGANGLTYVPDLAVVANGLPIALGGVWRESKHNLTLELDDGTYSLHADAAVFGTGGVTHTETGDWHLDGSSLVLAAKGVKLDTLNGMHEEHDELAPDPPRTWSVDGVTVEWTTMGEVHEVRRADGIVISGPAPSWASGNWTWTLRRAK